MTTFRLPDLGEGLQEAEIVTWHVAPGAHVVADQPLVSVETDKAVVEVPAPFSGTVSALRAEVGEVIAIGAPLADIETGRDADKGAIVGDIEAAPKPKPARPKPAAPAAKAAAPRAKAAPAVRRLAAELGVDLATLAGSGPGGAITSDDVRATAGGREALGEPLRGTRRSMAEAMSRAGAEVVPATLTDWADIGGWAAGEEPMPRLVRALLAACRAEPALNAWYDAARGLRRLHETVDIAIAVDTPEGLFAPVLRDAGSLADIEASLADLVARTRDRGLAPAEMKGATVTLSNFGPLGGEHAALVVSPPQVAILGAGRIAERVLPVAGKPEVRRVLPLSLTFDHRVVTGGEAARFLAAVRADLETGKEEAGR